MDANNQVEFRTLRIHAILEGFLDRVERIPNPHPELIEMLDFAVNRFMEFAYRANALESCVEVSRIGPILQGMLDQSEPSEKFKADLKACRKTFTEAWNRDREKFGAPPEMPPAPAGVSAQALPDIRPESPLDSAETPAVGQPGCFDYLGGDEFPYDPELTEIFITEANEQIPNAERILLEMEAGGSRQSGIGELFRIMHTIKGNAGFLGLREFIRLVHAMEQYLVPFRNQEVDATRLSIDLMLEGIDTLQKLMGNLRGRVELLSQPTAHPDFNPTEWEGLAERFVVAGAA